MARGIRLVRSMEYEKLVTIPNDSVDSYEGWWASCADGKEFPY